jgi:hypothetical protein
MFEQGLPGSTEDAPLVPFGDSAVAEEMGIEAPPTPGPVFLIFLARLNHNQGYSGPLFDKSRCQA